VPYIKQDDRKLIDPLINKILAKIEPLKLQWRVEYANAVFRHCFTKLLTPPEDDEISDEFACEFYKLFKEEYNKSFEVAGKLNYFVSSICWKVVEGQGYSTRCYLNAKLHKLAIWVSSDDICYGVVHDVITELERRKTAAYEDQKIIENGDL
jgi:hypothetical protein